MAKPSLTVRVLLSPRGQWEVVLPGGRRPLRCQSLDDAERVAYVFAERSRPCEVLVHDAYHRVVRRHLINGHRVSADPAPRRPGTPPISPAPDTNI